MVRRTLALVAATVVALFITVPAHAGGPTSVLLSAPPAVTAFGYEDPRYNELQELTQPTTTERSGDHNIGRFVRATWLIHDMSVWRIDIIYPDAPGGPWILSQDTLTAAGPPTWHRATDPTKLVQLLAGLKLLNGQFQGGPTLADGFTLEQPTPAPEPTAEPAAVSTVQPATTSLFTGWRWILPGLLLGAAATVLAVRFLPNRRWELIDQDD